MNLNLGDTRLIIEACKEYGCLRNQAAYLLATAYHETAHTMKPVTEYGGEKYLKSKKYWPWVGRGYVQVTWEYNYKKLSEKTGVDLMSEPNKALNPKIAATALVAGTMEGWWTGRGVPKYVTLQKSDFYNARRTVNGTDKASLIAGHAKEYDEDLKAIGYGEESSPVAKVHKHLGLSKEVLAGGATMVTGGGLSFIGSLAPIAQTLLIVGVIGLGAFIVYNRLKARADGER